MDAISGAKSLSYIQTPRAVQPKPAQEKSAGVSDGFERCADHSSGLLNKADALKFLPSSAKVSEVSQTAAAEAPAGQLLLNGIQSTEFFYIGI